MPISSRCPSCGRRMQAGAHGADRRCPCGRVAVIPGADTGPEGADTSLGTAGPLARQVAPTEVPTRWPTAIRFARRPSLAIPILGDCIKAVGYTLLSLMVLHAAWLLV